ncbi:MAG: VWA domain-containing protein [Bryobacteraceae bacterium]
MFLLNLTAVEFLAIFTALSGIVVGLYLLNRSRKKQVVSTLRFWTAAQQSIATRQRRRIQQPLSLLLQLLSLLLLLLALAQLRFGSRENSSRDHVLLLDTSSWMAARSAQKTLLAEKTLLDDAKAKARAYLKALPSTDRVMLIRSRHSPVRHYVERDRDRCSVPSISRVPEPLPSICSRPSPSLTNPSQVSNPGEIVYIGTGRPDPATQLQKPCESCP